MCPAAALTLSRVPLLWNSIPFIQISFNLLLLFALIIDAHSLEASQPASSDSKSAIWPLTVRNSRKVGSEASGHGLKRSLWQEQTEMETVRQSKQNLPLPKNFPLRKKSRCVPTKSILNVTALPATRWKTGSVPNAKLCKSRARPRKKPRPQQPDSRVAQKYIGHQCSAGLSCLPRGARGASKRRSPRSPAAFSIRGHRFFKRQFFNGVDAVAQAHRLWFA